MDCQFVGNPWGVAQYVAYYTSKHEPAVRSVNELRKAVLKLTPETPTHVVFRTLANANNGSRHISLQEAYWLLRNYDYAKMSRNIIRVQAVPRQNRNMALRRNISTQNTDNTNIYSNGPKSKAGQFINYALRPDELEDLPFRDFLEQYSYTEHNSTNAMPLRENRGYVVQRRKLAIVSP